MVLIGVNAWTYPKHISVEKAMQHARSVGYDSSELTFEQEDLERDHDDLKSRWRSLKQYAESLELLTPTVATALYWRYNMILENHLEGVTKLFKLQCLMASEVDAYVILVVPGIAIASIGYEDHINRVVNALKRLGNIARDHGVKVGLENVWNRILAGPLEFKTLLERLEPEIYGLYLDVANTLPHSLAEHWIRIFRERIFALHAKDLDLSSMRFGPPLTGNVNWPEIKRALEEIGYRGPVTVETPPYPGDPFKSSEDSISALKKIFGFNSKLSTITKTLPF